MTPTSKRPQVLFIDDETVVLDGIRRTLLLQNVDWDTAFISDPMQALEDKRALSADVIVTDLRMPHMTGLELMKALRTKGMSAQVIILTGTGDMGSALEAINEISAFRFYIKPCPQPRLIEGITEAIAQRQATNAAADLLPYAVLSLDKSRCVTFMNKEGAKLVAAGTVIVVDGMGRCHATTTAQTTHLYQSIDTAIATGETIVFGLDAPKTEIRYSVLIERATEGSTAVFMFVMDPTKQIPPSQDALKHLFDFSNSEAKLAHGLALGLDIKEVAESMGVTIQTARTYLKSLFEKTATNRQAELVRVLITAVPQVGMGLR